MLGLVAAFVMAAASLSLINRGDPYRLPIGAKVASPISIKRCQFILDDYRSACALLSPARESTITSGTPKGAQAMRLFPIAHAVALVVLTACSSLKPVVQSSDLTSSFTACQGGNGITGTAQRSGCDAFIQGAADGDKRLPKALVSRCYILLGNNNEAAFADCSRAIALKPDDSDAYFARAKVFDHKNDYDHAIADYSQTISFEPHAGGAYLLRGMDYLRKGQYDLAIADFSRPGANHGMLDEAKDAKARIAAGQKLGDPRAWCDGKALPQEGGMGMATDLVVSGCTKLIQSGKEKRAALAQDYYKRATAYDLTSGSYGLPDTETAGDRNNAIADYKHALKLNPRDAEAYWGLGSIYYLGGEQSRAITNFSAAVNIGKPRMTLYLEYLGYAHHENGQYALAIADFTRLLKLDQKSADAYLHRSMAYVGKGSLDMALADCHRAIQYSQTSEATEGNNSCGNAHFRKGDYAAAIADYDAALKLYPEYAEALFGRGAARIRSGDAGGQTDMETAQKSKPGIAAAEAKLGIGSR
jgi:tetratricopeptide (TPR) repeat protein